MICCRMVHLWSKCSYKNLGAVMKVSWGLRIFYCSWYYGFHIIFLVCLWVVCASCSCLQTSRFLHLAVEKISIWNHTVFNVKFSSPVEEEILRVLIILFKWCKSSNIFISFNVGRWSWLSYLWSLCWSFWLATLLDFKTLV